MSKLLTPKAIEILEKVQVRLLRQVNDPTQGRFNMDYWGVPMSRCYDHVTQYSRENPPACNTQACLAGEIVLAANAGYITKKGGIKLHPRTVMAMGSYWNVESIPQAASFLLFGSTSFSPEAARLFYLTRMRHNYGWSLATEKKYEAAETPAERAWVGIERISEFIRSDGQI